ncbi:monooxygenase 2-like [Amaranthus tricolor]|uniref:monooxygenase 2-like n=1 Tax=Amaranthus tricolor TaxID=29722 RepID=UPI00258A409C|nr:monooxygenase 2-like [Amaranthus tricolor]
MESSNENIVIVGGGIAGLSLALALHRLGIRSLVLESSESLRVTGSAFNTWTNGWRALDALGIADSLRSQHYQLFRHIVTSTTSGVVTAKVSYGEHEVRCVKRRVLLETLANELPSNTIRFSSKVVSIQTSGYLKVVHLADGSTFMAKVLIGCEGVNSIVARWLGFNKPSFTKRFGIRGFVQFKENHCLNQEFLQFNGHGYRYGIVPCDATNIYWFFSFSPSNQEEELLQNPMKIKEFVLKNLGQVQDHIKTIFEETKVEDIICSHLRYRPPWEYLWGKISKDNVCVAGDALHPMTPDTGQGACSALEDAIILGKCLSEVFSPRSSKKQDKTKAEEHKRIETSLKKYAKDRKWRAIDLITTAYFVGFIQQSDGKVISLIRDKVMAPFLAKLRLKAAQFDCGSLWT